MGNLVCRGFLRGWLFLSGTFSCGCPSGATGVPLFTIWDSVAGPGRCVFITAGPIIKLCAGGEGDSEGHVL